MELKEAEHENFGESQGGWAQGREAIRLAGMSRLKAGSVDCVRDGAINQGWVTRDDVGRGRTKRRGSLWGRLPNGDREGPSLSAEVCGGVGLGAVSCMNEGQGVAAKRNKEEK